MEEELQLQIGRIEEICHLIEDGKEYEEELAGYLPMLNRTVGYLMNCALSADEEISLGINELVVRILKDVLYGMEQKDDVFMLDVLKYGLLELFYESRGILQDGDIK